MVTGLWLYCHSIQIYLSNFIYKIINLILQIAIALMPPDWSALQLHLQKPTRL